MTGDKKNANGESRNPHAESAPLKCGPETRGMTQGHNNERIGQSNSSKKLWTARIVAYKTRSKNVRQIRIRPGELLLYMCTDHYTHRAHASSTIVRVRRFWVLVGPGSRREEAPQKERRPTSIRIQEIPLCMCTDRNTRKTSRNASFIRSKSLSSSPVHADRRTKLTLYS